MDIDISDIVIDIRDHASDALAEIGEPGSVREYLLDEYHAFNQVANWLAARYNVREG